MDEIHRLTRVTARGLHLPRQAFNADTDRGPKGKGRLMRVWGLKRLASPTIEGVRRAPRRGSGVATLRGRRVTLPHLGSAVALGVHLSEQFTVLALNNLSSSSSSSIHPLPPLPAPSGADLACEYHSPHGNPWTVSSGPRDGLRRTFLTICEIMPRGANLVPFFAGFAPAPAPGYILVLALAA